MNWCGGVEVWFVETLQDGVETITTGLPGRRFAFSVVVGRAFVLRANQGVVPVKLLSRSRSVVDFKAMAIGQSEFYVCSCCCCCLLLGCLSIWKLLE